MSVFCVIIYTLFHPVWNLSESCTVYPMIRTWEDGRFRINPRKISFLKSRPMPVLSTGVRSHRDEQREWAGSQCIYRIDLTFPNWPQGPVFNWRQTTLTYPLFQVLTLWIWSYKAAYYSLILPKFIYFSVSMHFFYITQTSLGLCIVYSERGELWGPALM